MPPVTTNNLGRYELLAEVGRGAMGVVYQARDPKIDRLVAIKTISVALISNDKETDQNFRERFLLEARAAGRLSHPGIVTVFDVGEDPQAGAPYIVMEYVAGQSLQRVLGEQGKLPLETSLMLAQELAEALDYAHQQGVVHRDMKPANILLTEDGHAKIADFGIAKLTLAHLTLGGHAFGTPAYMAPEQLEGGDVDGRADLFSLGVILYAMLTGHRPFQGNSAATVSFKVMNREPVPVTAFDAHFPPAVDSLLTRAMSKDPKHRYQTGQQMAKDIEGILLGMREATDPALGPITGGTQGLRELAAERSILKIASPARAAGYLAGLLLVVVTISAYIGYMRSLVAPPPSLTPAVAVSRPVENLEKAGSRAVRAGVFGPMPTLETVLANAHAGQKTKLKPVASVGDSNLLVSFEHHFLQAKIYLWIDDHLAYSHPLKARAKRKLILFKEFEGEGTTTAQLPSGKHQLRVRVESGDGYDQSGSVLAEFPAKGTRVLRVRCDENPQRIALELE